MTLRVRFEIAFGDADPAGIAYYPRILDLCHRAFERFFAEAVGEPYAETFLRRGIGFPTVALASEFRAPMRFGDAVDVDVDIGKVSTRSVEFVYRFTRAGDGVRCATVRNTTVAVDRASFQAVAIPERYRRVFEAHREPAPAAEGP